MRGWIAGLLGCGALAACGSPADRQLEAVKSARSVLAEWAWVEELSSRRRVPATYAAQMRDMARDELQSSRPELSAEAAQLIDRTLASKPGVDALKRANAALEPVEKQLESD